MNKTKKITLISHFVDFLIATVLILLFNFLFPILIYAQEAIGGNNIYEINIGDIVYRVHEFTTVGNHQLSVNQNLEIEYLVVAGGGGGGGSLGGGGGAGGYLSNINGPKLSLLAQTYTVTIGAGGGSQGSGNGYNGGNSLLGNLVIANGGGGGASNYGGTANTGGSGGGGVHNNTVGANGIVGQGNRGGNGGMASIYAGGGGGGAGAAGEIGNQTTRVGGHGGGGKLNNITGTSKYYAGGGGGGAGTRSSAPSAGGNGGAGGGGAGGRNNRGGNGVNNTGGGGGGGGTNGTLGGNGGSGIVIIRYEISQFNLNINNGDVDITPTKTSPEFTLSGTIDYPDDGDATSVAVSATIGGINRSINVPVSDNMTWELSWSYNELTEGEYTNIEFTSTSNSATPEETTSTYTGKIIIDKTAPTCGNWSPSENPWKVSGGEYFTLTSSSDTGGSGLATNSASLSCSTGPLHGDTCPVTIFDKAGNDQICPSPINRVDIFVPNLTVTPAITGWQGDKQDIIVLSEDNETSIARIAYAWDLNTLGADCSGGTTISSGDNLRLTISGGANPLYVCSLDLAGNVSTFTNIYQYIPPVFSSPNLQKQVTPPNLYWNIQSVSETSSYIEVKGFFPKTTGNYHYALEYIIPTINKSYTQALRTSPFTETHFTIIIPTTDFNASKDNHTFSGPQKLKITDLDQMEATTIDHNLTFFFPIHQSNHRKDFNYFIFASDNRLNELGE